MNLLSRFVSWLFDPDYATAQAAAEAYLSQAVDMNDLEYRMRQLDARRTPGPFGLNA
jgi:hypothetical protein